MAARLLGDDPADLGRPGEVDSPRRRMGDQFVNDVLRVLGCIRDEVDHARRQAGVDQCADDRRVGAGAELGGFEDDSVRVRQRCRDRARREDHRRVPRRDPDDHAGGRPDSHRELAGNVRRDHLADEAVSLRRRLAQHPGRELDVEHSPAEHAAGLLGHDPGDLLLALHQQVRGLRQDRAPDRRRAPRPLRERGAGRVSRGVGVLATCGGRPPNLIAGIREALLVLAPRLRTRPAPTNQQLLVGKVDRRHLALLRGSFNPPAERYGFRARYGPLCAQRYDCGPCAACRQRRAPESAGPCRVAHAPAARRGTVPGDRAKCRVSQLGAGNPPRAAPGARARTTPRRRSTRSNCRRASPSS